MMPPSSSRFICCMSEAAGRSAPWLPARRSAAAGRAAGLGPVGAAAEGACAVMVGVPEVMVGVPEAAAAGATADEPAAAEDTATCLPPELSVCLLRCWGRCMRRRSVWEAYSSVARRRASSSCSCAYASGLASKRAAILAGTCGALALQLQPPGPALGRCGGLPAACRHQQGGGRAGALAPRGGPAVTKHRSVTCAAAS